jgi:hypothetical protein
VTLPALLAFAACVGAPAGRTAPTDEAPDYPHGKFRADCQLCHRAEAWTPARPGRSFDHGKLSGFPLTGAHAAAACRQCHASLDFGGTAGTRCATCHEDPHRGELGMDCARCHTPRTFIERSRMIRAHALTHFPLTGAHAGLDCETCHPMAAQGQLRFVGTPSDCEGCHMPDYRATTQPPHNAAAFPTQCETCHRPIAWRPASFDHSRTGFPLTGAHLRTPCMSCHGDGVYAGKPTACVSCHQADYDGTNDPSHAAAGFPVTCENCHNTSSWDDATFDHDTANFPIYSGRHAGRWAACSTCHTNPQNFSVFTCFSCHPHSDPVQTQSNHGGVNGYAYDSNACYACHPRGNTP